MLTTQNQAYKLTKELAEISEEIESLLDKNNYSSVKFHQLSNRILDLRVQLSNVYYSGIVEQVNLENLALDEGSYQ